MASLYEMFPGLKRPEHWRTSIADIVRVFNSPVVLISAPEFGGPPDAEGKYAFPTMVTCENLPEALLPEFSSKFTLGVDFAQSTSGKRCKECQDKLRPAGLPDVPTEDGVWFQYWTGKVSGCISQALILTPTHSVKLDGCVDTESLIFFDGSKLAEEMDLRVVVVVSIDGGPVTNVEKLHIPQICRNVLADLRRRRYSWAGKVHIVWVHYPTVTSMLASFAGARELTADPDPDRYIEHQTLILPSGFNASTTYTVGDCMSGRGQAESLVSSDPETILDAREGVDAELASYFAAVWNQDVQTAALYLDKHPDWSRRREETSRRLPLWCANVLMVRLLLDHGAHVDGDVNEGGISALVGAIVCSNSDIVEELLKRGANPLFEIHAANDSISAWNECFDHGLEVGLAYTAVTLAEGIARRWRGTEHEKVTKWIAEHVREKVDGSP